MKVDYNTLIKREGYIFLLLFCYICGKKITKNNIDAICKECLEDVNNWKKRGFWDRD